MGDGFSKGQCSGLGGILSSRCSIDQATFKEDFVAPNEPKHERAAEERYHTCKAAHVRVPCEPQSDVNWDPIDENCFVEFDERLSGDVLESQAIPSMPLTVPAPAASPCLPPLGGAISPCMHAKVSAMASGVVVRATTGCAFPVPDCVCQIALGSKPVARPRNGTLIIFDWDDTLICSSALSIATPAQLFELAAIVERLLQEAAALGETLIVTNAHAAWVKGSATRFLSRLVPILDQLEIISARERFEERFPGDCFAWKRQAFCEVLQARAPNSGNLNLLALGDSPAEIQAAEFAAAQAFHDAKASPLVKNVKTVKFKVAPTPLDLIGELRAVGPELGRLVCEGRSFSKTLVQHTFQTPPKTCWTLDEPDQRTFIDQATDTLTRFWHVMH